MEFTANQIATYVGGTVEGDGEVKVSTFAKIEEGRKGALTFLANPKYTHFVYNTEASVVLVSNEFVAEHPVTATLIRVANPYETLAELMSSYSTALSSITGGRSSFTMKFASYELVPGDVQEKLLKEYAEKNQEE
jgi:UDP-3-O-[3-hydroxymyristoyl] glucosamine N-acyltransferase